eukprot:2105596-Pleurochrysis_carterae.AAC.1
MYTGNARTHTHTNAHPFTLFALALSVRVRAQRLLATSLVLEAFYAWSWWSLAGDAGAFSQVRR